MKSVFFEDRARLKPGVSLDDVQAAIRKLAQSTIRIRSAKRRLTLQEFALKYFSKRLDGCDSYCALPPSKFPPHHAIRTGTVARMLSGFIVGLLTGAYVLACLMGLVVFP